MDGIMQVGDALQMMVGGSIIKVHMKVITIAHDKSCHITRDVNEEMESKETEQDEELYKISSTLLMWQANYEWLKLMVMLCMFSSPSERGSENPSPSRLSPLHNQTNH